MDEKCQVPGCKQIAAAQLNQTWLCPEHVNQWLAIKGEWVTRLERVERRYAYDRKALQDEYKRLVFDFFEEDDY